MFTYLKISDLPDIPDQFVKEALDLAEANATDDDSYLNTHAPLGYRKRPVIFDNKTYESRSQSACHLSDDWHSWVCKNITDDYMESGVRINNDNGSPVHGPHTDFPLEKFKLFYLVKTGGDNVITEWYKEPSQPVHRAPGSTANDFSAVDVLDSICIPERTWILFNTNILHGVRNLESQRVNIVVSISPDHPLIRRYFV